MPMLTIGFEDQKRERNPWTHRLFVLDRKLRYTEPGEKDARLQRIATIYILIVGQTLNKHQLFMSRF
jgi:hypothetical protein